MARYFVRRLLQSLFAAWLLTLFVFCLLRVLPGSVAFAFFGEDTTPQLVAQVRAQLGLDRPLLEQYVIWLGQVVTLDLRSFFGSRPVIDIIRADFPVTLNLAVYSILITLVVALPMGIVAAVRRGTWIDYSTTIFNVFGVSLPTFWVGILLLFGLVMWVGWSPPLTWTSPLDDPLGNASQMIWPALTLAWGHLAAIARMARSSILESLANEYVTTARAKGLAEQTVLLRHVLRNALIPIVTLGGIQIAALLTGSMVVERVFNLRGIGWDVITAVQNRDYPVVEGLILFMAGIVLCVNLVVDLVYFRLDPRIRLQ